MHDSGHVCFLTITLQVLAGLKHPNVVAYKDSFSDEFQVCIVIAFCEVWTEL